MKVIITGTTGMVGKGVLLECLDDAKVEQVLVINRNPLGIQHAKLREVIHSDFSEFTSIHSELAGYDACFFCMGVSSVGMKEADYKIVTYNFTLALAKVLLKLNPESTFTYVSGVGTDSTEKGRTMWARVKGKTENDLLKLGFNQAFMFRPGMIIPKRGIKSRTKLYQFMYDYFMWLVNLIKFLSPNSVVDTTQVGKAMINSVKKGYSKNILEPKDILELVK
ncbi:MAG: NAD-dependent epimerase/dehydratase family protein [Draconibacterium sp.]